MSAHGMTETRAAPITGFLMGTITGMAIFAVSCLVPIFLIIGIPALVLGPVMGLTARRGPCPKCTTPVMVIGGKGKCRCCGHRLKIRGKMLEDVT